MRKAIIGAIFLVVAATSAAIHYKARNMLEINFLIGENIVETAKKTNIPEFNVSNTNGSLHYQVMQLPSDAVAVYNRKEFEIRTSPVFSINFWADRSRSKINAVHAFQVKIDTQKITSHRAAREFIDSIISQFNKGQWQRRISTYCPAITGRSVFLNADGALDSDGCALDPTFSMNQDEWINLFANQQNFEWLGEGVFAQLSILYNDRTPQPIYEIVLLFEDYKTKLTIIRDNETRRLELGDAKGWKSSAINAQELIATKETIKILEANAVKRGDKVLVRVEDPK